MSELGEVTQVLEIVPQCEAHQRREYPSGPGWVQCVLKPGHEGLHRDWKGVWWSNAQSR